MGYRHEFIFNSKEFKIYKVNEFVDDIIVFNSFNAAKHDLSEYLRFIIWVWEYSRENRRAKEYTGVLNQITLLAE